MRLLIIISLISLSAEPIHAQMWDDPSEQDTIRHSTMGCLVANCHKRHKSIITIVDSLTGNETVTIRTWSGWRGDGPSRLLIVEKTRTDANDLLTNLKRKRTPKRGVRFTLKIWDHLGMLALKKTGKRNKKVTKEYHHGKLVRHNVTRNRELIVKKDLNRPQ